MSDRPEGGPGAEEEWARIVSGLDDVRRAGDRHLTGPRDWSPEDAVFGGGPPAGAGPAAAETAEDDDRDWSPDPGPVTQGLGLGVVLAWAVLVGVPALLVVLALLPGSLPWWATITGLVAVVVAIGHLLHCLPEDRDDFDDGARL